MVSPYEKFDLSGKTALVTGGAMGLGYSLSRALARSGARVLIAARREEALREAAKTLGEDPLIKEVFWHRVDLADSQSIQSLVDYADSTLGGIDIYVGNAAVNYAEQVPEIKASTVDEIVQINLTANLLLTQAFLPKMRERRWGRLIFISSIGSMVAAPRQGSTVYAATKSAINSLARTLAADFGREGITANSLVLGVFMTDMVNEAVEQLRQTHGEEAAREFIEDYTSITALGRFGLPEELEGLIQLIASDAGAYITGSNLVIDGGMGIMMRPLHSN